MRLGILPTIAPYLSGPLLQLCRQEFPEIDLAIVEDVTENVMRALDAAELDFAVISTCRPGPGMQLQRWFKEPLLAALPLSHSLARQKGVTWRQLRNETVLLLHESHCLSRQIQRACAQYRVQFRRANVLQLSTLLALVSSGAGLTFMPSLACDAVPGGCAIVPFLASPPARDINVVKNRSHYQSKAAAAVENVTRTVLAGLFSRP